MKNLKQYITEEQNFLVNKKLNNRQDKYEYYPKNEKELMNIIIDLLKRGITDLNCIDVSNITDMYWLFYVVNKTVTVKDIDISEWNVSNVTNMSNMFYNCKKFNSDLSKWNVSNVTDTNHMFYLCKKFNADLSKWNISKVNNMCWMFGYCKKFDCDLTKWKVNPTTDITDMFDDCDTLIKNNKIPKWYN